MLKELAEYGHRREEKVKAMKSEIKANSEGTKSHEEETMTHIDSFDPKEDTNIQAEQNEKIGIQKIEEMVRNLWDTLKGSNIRIIGVPEEEEEQEIRNLFDKNNERKLPQSGKGNGLPGSPGSSKSPKEVGPKEAHSMANPT